MRTAARHPPDARTIVPRTRTILRTTSRHYSEELQTLDLPHRPPLSTFSKQNPAAHSLSMPDEYVYGIERGIWVRIVMDILTLMTRWGGDPRGRPRPLDHRPASPTAALSDDRDCPPLSHNAHIYAGLGAPSHTTDPRPQTSHRLRTYRLNCSWLPKRIGGSAVSLPPDRCLASPSAFTQAHIPPPHSASRLKTSHPPLLLRLHHVDQAAPAFSSPPHLFRLRPVCISAFMPPDDHALEIDPAHPTASKASSRSHVYDAIAAISLSPTRCHARPSAEVTDRNAPPTQPAHQLRAHGGHPVTAPHAHPSSILAPRPTRLCTSTPHRHPTLVYEPNASNASASPHLAPSIGASLHLDAKQLPPAQAGCALLSQYSHTQAHT
ncbi:hypothetical protein B0H16DRAFT_1716826 [Mycena metata]|uniref:Uncharacterized protein n=1 Tax=Mycena metata TaxID=1033252 RepID=A0AAD7JL70_9AGAR|nr:hypothetical protein B0H16DRAFT_1716826 [Mycena metata]